MHDVAHLVAAFLAAYAEADPTAPVPDRQAVEIAFTSMVNAGAIGGDRG